MFLYLTIGILFVYTIVLVGFFMGWCALIPTRYHSRKDLPFSVRSPRRNTKYGEIESVSSSTSLELIRHLTDKERFLITSGAKKKCSLPDTSIRSDYLHPKYSLPPVSIDIMQRRWEFETLLRVPGRSVRSPSQDVPHIQIEEV